MFAEAKTNGTEAREKIKILSNLSLCDEGVISVANHWEFRGHDKEQVRLFLKNYYNPDSQFLPTSRDKRVKAIIRGSQSDAFFQSAVIFNCPFRYKSQQRNAFALLSCRGGNLILDSNQGGPVLNAGNGACISPKIVLDTTCTHNINVVVTWLDAHRTTRICSAWLGTALDEPPQLEFTPFSPELQARWDLVVRSIELMHAQENIEEWTSKSLEEYAVSLLLNGHPNTYTNYLGTSAAASARIVADADAFIRENAERPITPAAVARAFGCSLSALRKGFEEHLGISVRECIYAARVARTRNKLLNGSADSYLDVLRASGFINISRFETVYYRLYGEAPTETFRNSRTQGRGERSDCLSPEKAERLRLHIITSLSKPLRISELAALSGMSTTQFRLAFKKVFGTSPAQYILMERLNWAQWLLSNTAKSIASVAAEVGFSSQAHLTTAFKQFQGVTPGELRRSRPPRRG